MIRPFPKVAIVALASCLVGCGAEKRIRLAVHLDERGYIFKIYSYYEAGGTNVLHGDSLEWNRLGLEDGKLLRWERAYSRFENGQRIFSRVGGIVGGNLPDEQWVPKDAGMMVLPEPGTR